MCPNGLYATGPAIAKREFEKDPTKVGRQLTDRDTGKPLYAFPAFHQNAERANRAAFEVTVLSDTAPDLEAIPEVLPGMRLVELEGLTLEPRIQGDKPYQFITFTWRCTGVKAFTPPAQAGRPAQAPKAGA